MKRLALSILLFIIASPAWATTYFLAPAPAGGSDSNTGASASTPWLTPNHTVNCGDVILAAASTAYAETNFRTNQWGTVRCPGGNNVAWLKCVTFDACKIFISIPNAHDALTPTQSYWGVQGWEVTATGDGNACFEAYPPNSSTTIHHIIFANNICNGAYASGFTSGSNGSAGVDYLVTIGNIAYNAAQSNVNCLSGIVDLVPVNYDTLPGTHDYMAGNFSWGNVDPNPCQGGTPSDGQGLFFDTVSPYSGQIVIDNNISIFNGGKGIKILNNNTGSPNAKVHIRHNTTYGNLTGGIDSIDTDCAEIDLQAGLSSQVYANLVQTGASGGCIQPKQAAFPLGSSLGDATDIFYNNFIYSAAGNNTGGGATYTNNTTGKNPNFMNPVMPPAPSCGSFASVPACMATVIANFTPKTAEAKSYGYQIPSATPISDPLFPQWLCSVTNLPPGLVTMGCVAQSSLPASPTITGVTVQ